MTQFSISITSDSVCPWCYVGKKKLEAGIAAYNAANAAGADADTFTTSWHPFYLNPDSPKTGTDKQAMYESKFGAERTAMMQSRLSDEGHKVGIDFKYGGLTGNTRDSHRLIQMAGVKGGEELQTSVVAQLFRAYFEEEKDITSAQVLADAAVKGGVEREVVEGWLAGQDGGKEVDEEVMDARRNLVTGVPHFIINGKYEVQGAQDAQVFKKVFEKIKEIESAGKM